MNFTFLPSMEHMTLVKIVQTFWNLDDIRDEIVWYITYCLGNGFEEIKKWSEIESIITEKVSKLSLPKSLKKKIMDYVKPVGNFIQNWIEIIYLMLSHVRGNIHAILPNSFCWTPQGTIDQRKMVEMLIEDMRLQFITRYRLACNFCLEVAGIPMFRDKISKNYMMDYVAEHQSDVDETDVGFIWSDDLIRDVADETRRSWPTRYQNALECAAVGSNKAATEYFLKKLTHEEREECLISIAVDVVQAHNFPSPFLCEIFCFLLSQMTEGQQMKVFQKFPYALVSFLEWPWQHFFLKTANRVRDVFEVDNDSFMAILEVLTRKKVGWTDCNYQTLLGEFWKQSPNVCKTAILNDKDYFCNLLEELLWNEDRRNMELIFKDATPEQKKKYSPDTSFISRIFKKINDWDLLKFFIEEFVSSEELVMKFVEGLNKRTVEKSFEGREDLWNNLSRLLNGLADKVDRTRGRRRSERLKEASGNPAKRLCCRVIQ